MVFATNNKNKVKELKDILKDYELISLEEAGIDIDIKETGKTFYENALIKAKTIFDLKGIPTIADDSGLIFEELKDWPGIYTKRIGDESEQKYQKRNQIFLDKGKTLTNKNIKAICCLVYYDGNKIISAEGVMEGTILDKEYPGNGFGFDSIFKLSDGRIVSQLDSKEKNQISHRYKASVNLKNKLKKEITI